MDYLTSLWEKFSSIFWGSSSSTPANSPTANQDQTETSSESSSDNHDIPVTKPTQMLVSGVQERSGPAQPTVNSHSVHLQNPEQYHPNPPTYPDEIANLDKINLNVKCGTGIVEVNMFPQESISALLKEACERAGKKPEKMTLVFKGERLDVNKTVQQCGLRGGMTLNLIFYA